MSGWEFLSTDTDPDDDGYVGLGDDLTKYNDRHSSTDFDTSMYYSDVVGLNSEETALNAYTYF